MRRQQRRRPVSNVSLFPFLAVLICTMGALVVLLVIVVQQARVEADVVTDKQLETELQKIEAVEDAEWRLEMLAESRSDLRSQLQQERLRLAGIETHIRKLILELEQMQERARLLEEPVNGTQTDRSELGHELSRLHEEIRQRQQYVESLREEAAQAERSYAITAYEGPHGTRRRPIFIECLADRIVIQPEGIVLKAEDFTGQQGPGNPLAAALRATREYLDQYDPAARQGEPYPLLVVRPQGSEAYVAARRAIKSWDAEFGYELVDDGKKLKYPAADPALARLLNDTVDEARQRRMFLAQAAPSRFGGGHLKSGLVLSADGGFVRQDGGSRHGAGDGWRDKPGDAFGNDGPFDPDQQAKNGDESQHETPAAHSAKTIPKNRPGQKGEPKNNAGKAGGDAPEGLANPSAAGQTGTAVSAGMAPMAQSRGNDWATPGKTRGAIGFTRPIRVGCYSDRLVIHPERGDSLPPRVIMIPETTRRIVEQFVSQVWTHMESWGIAGRQSYWKPVLKVEVNPGGEQRFLELETLLDSSGMDVQRK